MPYDSSAVERVPEPPPEEASEAALKKAPEGRPELRVVAPPEEATLEVSPPAAQETFSDQTKETVAGLQSESKGFVGKLYEKVKSSEVVQNVVDRYQVWRNEGLAIRAQSKVEKLGVSQNEAQEEAARFDTSAAKVRELSLKSQATLREMKVEVSPEVKNQVKAEYDAHLARAEEGRDKAQDIEGRIQDVRTEQEQYKTKVEEARGHLDGRLAAKAEINNQAIQEHSREVDDIKAGLESDQQYFKELDGHAEKLRALLKEDLPKHLRPTIEKNLKDTEGRQARLLVEIKRMEATRAKIESKIKDLEAKNTDLRAKRDKIFPPKEKPAEAEKPAEKPTGYEVNEVGTISISFGGGRELRIADGKINEFKSDGRTEEINLDDADDTTLDYLATFSAAALEKAGASPKVTARVEQLKTARQPEKEKQPKFLAGDIVAAWNQEMGKRFGLQVSLEKGADPKKDLGSQAVAKEMILARLAKRRTGGDVSKLTSTTKGKVDKFFAERR